MRQDDRSAAPMRPFAAAPLSRLPAEAAKTHCEGLYGQLAGDLLAMTRQFKQQQIQLQSHAKEDGQVCAPHVATAYSPFPARGAGVGRKGLQDQQRRARPR